MAKLPGKRMGNKPAWALAALVLAAMPSRPLLAQTQTPPPAPAEAPAVPSATAEPANPAGPPLAPAADPDPAAAQTDLKAVEASIALSQERVDALKAEIAEMEGDRTKQNAALIAAAQRVKLAEIEVADIEERLSSLIVSELEVRGRLDGSNAEIANVLAALERISLNPPPALIVDPDDALGSARSAILISAIVPQLRAKADAVTADLKQLNDIKASALAEEATLKANFSVLEEEQLRIATLIAARKQGIDVRSSELAAQEAEAVALAARATTLKDLIDSLSARANAVQTPSAPTDPNAVTMTPEQIRVALANSARTEPAMPFANAKGYLTMPANGVNVVDYGAGDGFGGISHGISVVTRAEAQVVAPADGWVLYKGPYLNYGQIIILNTGQNYTTLLAGLDAVSVDIGQFVLMGEPLGTMGSRTIGRTVTTNAGNSQPTLYIELRQNNEPLDPTGWWATPTQSG
ncbi:peptidoglycan DD-metalloendopeptidase family protein [Devosia neptuniae]|uniref:Peptidoglycan DD-metalloendopeptidase family protein n=1 Tax=Devosia neptuniae TaxID=191302 RepID=A0ABY6CH19_9HYPH|nr:peptidoglycan DD-metalloendopeptidase family protein [Devosia neptuniae]UXN71524.1 peptidoglycan DD-metalloendopeptidase family protein [Devosia neptuniae]